MSANIYNDHAEENSLEHVLVSEVYPKKQIKRDQVDLLLPFVPLCGESVEFLGKTSEGVIALSNYRLFIESFVNIPVGLIEAVEYRDIFHLHMFSKDARTIRCKFLTNDACLEWYKRLLQAIQPRHKLQDIFAFAFSAWYMDAWQHQELLEGLSLFAPVSKPTEEGHLYSFGKEVQRLLFDTQDAWRITYINEKFNICSSYPKYHLVPSSVTDKDIESIANFRSSRRFPSIVWRDVRNGAVLARSSQPEVGWLGWRNTQDENFLQSVAVSCRSNPRSSVLQKPNTGDVCWKEKDDASLPNGFLGNIGLKSVLIIDARSYAAAVANRAKGGGCECADYYINCEIMFMSLANIHAIRKSFLALRSLCAMSPEQPGWLTNIENTKWLHHISGLLKASLVVVNAIDKEHRCVLVHCSDGWDRTPQIVGLAELMLDPYYRTMEGFQVLVEKEWLEFGHKFADRCGQGLPTEDANERCPVFLQWLDCVHQLLYQFPCAFQFNEAFLVKLVQHTYSCLFGDFFCNTERERLSERIYQQTISVWKLLCCTGNRFVNHLFRPVSERDRILRPSWQIQSLHLWNAVYLSEMMSFAASAEDLTEMVESESSSSTEASPDLQMPAKTRSCEDLGKEIKEEMHCNQITRRLSDPNLAREFPLDSLSPESTRMIPLLNQIKTNHDDGLRQMKSCKIVNSASEVNKCASVETLKAHEDDEHVIDMTVRNTGPESASLLNEKLWSKLNCCDTLNNNDSHNSTEHCNSAVDIQTNRFHQAPSSFEDSSETLTGDLTEANHHLLSAETLLNRSDNECASLLANSEATGADCFSFDGASANLPLVNNTADCISASADSGLSAAAAAKVMLEKCSSTSDLNNIWQMNRQQNPDLKWLTNAPDGITQNFAAPQPKLPYGGLAENQKIHSSLPPLLPFPLPEITSGFSKDTEMGGSETPSGCSSNPITPNGESKLAALGTRLHGRQNRSLDYDGLNVYYDPVQQRIAQIRAEHEQQIRQLQRQLIQAKVCIRQMTEQNGIQCVIDNYRDEAASTDSGGERGSLGGGSAVASDLSWEQVEEKDAQMTLWIPDHVVTHCTGCDQEFWVARRKHHCRSCGQVFCDECSKYSIPVPQQHLNGPVRVCKKCYSSVNSNSADSMLQSSVELGRSATAESGIFHK